MDQRFLPVLLLILLWIISLSDLHDTGLLKRSYEICSSLKTFALRFLLERNDKHILHPF